MLENRNSFPLRIKPDIKYSDLSIQRFINSLMRDGKKSIARKIVYGSLEEVKKGEFGVVFETMSEMFRKVIANSRPSIEVVSKRIKGATYPVPTSINTRRAEMLVFRWILTGCEKKTGHMQTLLTDEFNAILSGKKCYTLEQRDTMHSMAKANRAFSHFGRERI